MTIPIVVRHGGRSYDVDVDEHLKGISLKQRLAALTGVPPERQKVLIKGSQLKDDGDLSSLKAGQLVMMLGSATELPTVTPKSVVESAISTSEEIQLPAGLENEGNTCYANATLQALKQIPELCNALEAYSGNSGLVTSLGSSLKKMKPSCAVTLTPFLIALREAHPQFAEQGEFGMFKQQDAEELWTQLLNDLRQAGVKQPGTSKPIVENLFGGCFKTVLESSIESEAPVTSIEEFDKLSCHIQMGTNFLKDGLLAGMKEEIEKHSETSGANAKYKLTKRINRLPQYLTVHFVRFFWRRDTSKKSKILRKVAFPLRLDMLDMCTEELQQKMAPARAELRSLENEIEEKRRAARRKKYDSLSQVKDVDDKLSDERIAELRAKVVAKIDPDLRTDTNPTGLYELVAVVTHQGMSADSGHYQCFGRDEKDPKRWWKFNDASVSLVDEAKIETLSGGGESDSALILLYKSSF